MDLEFLSSCFSPATGLYAFTVSKVEPGHIVTLADRAELVKRIPGMVVVNTWGRGDCLIVGVESEWLGLILRLEDLMDTDRPTKYLDGWQVSPLDLEGRDAFAFLAGLKEIPRVDGSGLYQLVVKVGAGERGTTKAGELQKREQLSSLISNFNISKIAHGEGETILQVGHILEVIFYQDSIKNWFPVERRHSWNPRPSTSRVASPSSSSDLCFWLRMTKQRESQLDTAHEQHRVFGQLSSAGFRVVHLDNLGTGNYLVVLKSSEEGQGRQEVAKILGSLGAFRELDQDMMPDQYCPKYVVDSHGFYSVAGKFPANTSLEQRIKFGKEMEHIGAVGFSVDETSPNSKAFSIHFVKSNCLDTISLRSDDQFAKFSLCIQSKQVKKLTNENTLKRLKRVQLSTRLSETDPELIQLTERQISSFVWQTERLDRSVKKAYSRHLTAFIKKVKCHALSVNEDGLVVTFRHQSELEAALHRFCCEESNTLDKLALCIPRFRLLPSRGAFGLFSVKKVNPDHFARFGDCKATDSGVWFTNKLSLVQVLRDPFILNNYPALWIDCRNIYILNNKQDLLPPDNATPVGMSTTCALSQGMTEKQDIGWATQPKYKECGGTQALPLEHLSEPESKESDDHVEGDDHQSNGTSIDISSELFVKSSVALGTQEDTFEKLSEDKEIVLNEISNREILLRTLQVESVKMINRKKQELAECLDTISKAKVENQSDIKEIKKLEDELTYFQTKVRLTEIEHTKLNRRCALNDELIEMSEKKRRELEEIIDRRRNDTKGKFVKRVQEELKQLWNKVEEKTKQMEKLKDEQNLSTSDSMMLTFLDESIKEKESDLECPICFVVCQAPILMCQEMHLICSDCRPKVTVCPVCRISYSGPHRRHRFAEKSAEELRKLKKNRKDMEDNDLRKNI